MRVSLIPLLLVCLFTVNAYGLMSGRMSYKWWKDPKVVEQLQLSDEQVGQIERIFTVYKEQIVQLQKQLREEDVKLRNALQNPHSTKEEILQMTDNVESVKASLSKVKIKMYLQVKDVLSEQQIKTLHELKDQYRQRRDRFRQ